MKTHDTSERIFILCVLAVFLVLFAVPLCCVILKSLSFDSFSLLTRKYYRHIIGFTILQSFVSVLFSFLLGLPLAWILSNMDFRFKRFVKAVYFIPFVVPSVLVVLGFVVFYGNHGVLAKILGREIHLLYNFKAIILAHVFFNFPIFAIQISDAVLQLDSAVEDEARSCGAGEVKIFFSITLPRLYHSILSSSVLAFILCFTSFSVIMVLGGSPGLTTVEVEIYRFISANADIGKACSLSFFSVFISSVFLIFQAYFGKKTSFQENSECKNRKPIIQNKCIRLISVFFVAFSVLFILCPLISVLFKGIGALPSVERKYILNTITIGLLSAFVSVTLGYGFCYTNFRFLQMLPMTVSSVVLGLSYFFISKYLGTVSTSVLLVFVHGILNEPFANKTMQPAFSVMPEEYKDWALLCGCDFFSYFRNVQFPLVRRSAISAFVFCFALSCGELNASLILGASRVKTMPVAIMRMISSYNFNGACAYGTILVIISLVLFGAISSL